MLGMALVFVILLGEIDLSAGVTAGVSLCIFLVLVNVQGLNWVLRWRWRSLSVPVWQSARSSVSSWRGSGSRHSLRWVFSPGSKALNSSSSALEVCTACNSRRSSRSRTGTCRRGGVDDAGCRPRRVGGDILLGSDPPRARRRPEPHDHPGVDQTRFHRTARRRRGVHPEPGPRTVRARRSGGAHRRTDRARDPVGGHVRARPHEVWPQHLCDRRQR